VLERTQRKVELTPAGSVFLDEARRTLTQADEAVRLARRAASDEVAQLHVTFVSAALYRVLPEVLRQFRATWPDIEIRLDELPTDSQLANLRSGAVDAGFVHPPLRDAADLEVEAVQSDRLVLALPETNALAGRDLVALSDLRDESFVLFPHRQDPALHGRILQACRRAGFLPRVAQEARQMHTILTLVASGIGVSLVPAGAQTMRIDGVTFRPIGGLPDDLAWDLAVVWRRKGATPALRRFLTAVREIAGEVASADSSGPARDTG